MNINKIKQNQWDDFTNNLQSHYNNEGYLFTEDLIRYWFVNYFMTIDKTKSKLNTEIEVPYLKGSTTKLRLKKSCPISLKSSSAGENRSRADLCYCNEDEVVEFKFNRCTRYSKSCTNSNLGSLLNDFNRLSILENKHKYSIYVCDEYMKNYLINRHKTNFPFLDFNKTIATFTYSKEYYNMPNFKDILKNAFSSFIDKDEYYKNPSLFDLRKFGYKIKLLYKNKISDSISGQNLYVFVFEIIS